MNAHFFLFLPVQQELELDAVTLTWVYEDINNELKLAHG